MGLLAMQFRDSRKRRGEKAIFSLGFSLVFYPFSFLPLSDQFSGTVFESSGAPERRDFLSQRPVKSRDIKRNKSFSLFASSVVIFTHISGTKEKKAKEQTLGMRD